MWGTRFWMKVQQAAPLPNFIIAQFLRSPIVLSQRASVRQKNIVNIKRKQMSELEGKTQSANIRESVQSLLAYHSSTNYAPV